MIGGPFSARLMKCYARSFRVIVWLEGIALSSNSPGVRARLAVERRYWQVPKAQVYRLTREGKLPTVRIGRYYRYRLAALEAFEDAGGAGVKEGGTP